MRASRQGFLTTAAAIAAVVLMVLGSSATIAQAADLFAAADPGTGAVVAVDYYRPVDAYLAYGGESAPIPLSADIRTPAPVGLGPENPFLPLPGTFDSQPSDPGQAVAFGASEAPGGLDAASLVGAGSLTPEEAAALAGALGVLTGGEAVPRVFDYTVVAGDTLWDIAQRYGVGVNTILGVNPDVSPSRLRVGENIRVMTVDGALHVVASGDTLSKIAAKYKTDVETIMLANDLADPSDLKVGDELILPGATPVIVHTATVAATAGGGTRTVTGDYRWPVMGSISSPFGWRWGAFHTGIDIAVPCGRTIVASRSGTVSLAGWNGGYGNCVIINHGDGVTTLYGHASKLLVSAGQWVQAGQAIALVGSTGNSTGPHCHFEIRINGSAVNPLDILP